MAATSWDDEVDRALDFEEAGGWIAEDDDDADFLEAALHFEAELAGASAETIEKHSISLSSAVTLTSAKQPESEQYPMGGFVGPDLACEKIAIPDSSGFLPTSSSEAVQPAAKRHRAIELEAVDSIKEITCQSTGSIASLEKTSPAAAGSEQRQGRTKTPVDVLQDRLQQLCISDVARPCVLREEAARYKFLTHGVEVLFPFTQGPMEPQRQVMENVLAALTSRKHAVLESPTGTGKTIAALCAALAWQRHTKVTTGSAPQIIFATRTHAQLRQAIDELRRTAYKPVTAVLASREAGLCIHPEVSSTESDVQHVRQSCRQARQQKRCCFHAGLQAAELPQLAVNQLRSGEAWDIEDAARFGISANACPYYTAHALARHAELVFCPYSYVLDPSVRQAAGLSWEDHRGHIIILDEAHNVEGVCRDAGSAEINLDHVKASLAALKRMLGEGDTSTFTPSAASVEVRQVSKTLQNEELGGFMLPATAAAASATLNSDRHNSYRRSQTPRQLVQTLRPLIALLGRVCSFITETQEATVFAPHLGAHRQVSVLLQRLKLLTEPLLRPSPRVQSSNGDCVQADSMPRGEALLRELVSRGAAGPYVAQLELAATLIAQLAVAAHKPELYVARIEKTGLQLWLMSAEGTLSRVAGEHQSVLLMSGTLAPLTITVAELGPTFGRRALPPLAAGHVVNRDALMLVTVAQSSSAASTKLECTFRAWKRLPFLLSIGQALLTVSRSIPGGILVFLPSYELLERCLEAWQKKESDTTDLLTVGSAGRRRGQSRGGKKRYRGAVERIPDEGPCTDGTGTAILDQLREAKGTVIVEPPPSQHSSCAASSVRAYEVAKQQYHEAIRQDGKCLLLAVYRGRMSEGVSFDDDFARGVVCIGIPFPNLTEERIAQKRACNDFWLSNGFAPVSGDAWYEAKALHAVAQALGRCIRHPRDFGALVLLDSRWAELGKSKSLPHWLQPFVHDKLDASSAAECLRLHFESIDATRKSEQKKNAGYAGSNESAAAKLEPSAQVRRQPATFTRLAVAKAVCLDLDSDPE